MTKQMPFPPPAFDWSQTVPQEPQPQLTPSFGPPEIECGYCGCMMRVGERAVSLAFGIVGRGAKSGRAMVLDDPAIHEDIKVVELHYECVESFVREEVFGGDPDPIFCARCEELIEDE